MKVKLQCLFLEPNQEAIEFPKEYPNGENHFNEERDVSISPAKYLDSLKCCDDRFPSNPQYIPHALGWTEGTAVPNPINFTEFKQLESEMNE